MYAKHINNEVFKLSAKPLNLPYTHCPAYSNCSEIFIIIFLTKNSSVRWAFLSLYHFQQELKEPQVNKKWRKVLKYVKDNLTGNFVLVEDFKSADYVKKHNEKIQ